MSYSWNNDELWQISINQDDFGTFEQPYVGNGILGTKFDKLVAGTDRKPLQTLSRAVYDGRKQPFLPAWNHIFLEAAGISYTPENGKHRLTQVLDIRNAVVTMLDHWEYKEGKNVDIEVEMFIPRTFGNSSYMSFTVRNLNEEASLKFGLLGHKPDFYYDQAAFSRVDDSTLMGDYRTINKNRPVSQAMSWKCTGMDVASANISRDGIEVTVKLIKGDARLELFHAVRSYAESVDTHADVLAGVGKLCELGRDTLFNINSTEWKRLWRNGLAFRNNNFDNEKSILVHQFYYMCTLEICDYPLAPLGLTSNEWCGSQLWDADLWTFRAIHPLWPDYARTIIDFRRKNLDTVKEHARYAGYKGAWYPCVSDDEGMNITPARYNDEIHINIWIARAAWEYYIESGDRQFLNDTAWPLISSIADFFASRVEKGADGLYHINCVLGPDESVCECGHIRVNDNFLINYGAKKLFETACEAADILGVRANEEWKQVGDKLFQHQPDGRGIIPEYTGYSDHGIKQADVILAFYPLGYEADEEIIRKNIIFYRDKQMYYGPLMSSQIESCILMKLGEKEKGLKRLFGGMAEFSRGQHFIPFECRDNDNSIMLTGIGGELQALIYGYYEADLKNFDKIPRVGRYMD